MAELQVLVDADACPVKEEVYRVALRHQVPVVIVANSYIRIPDHRLISRRMVTDGFDATDDWIVEQSGSTSLVITADILLAQRALAKGARVLAPTGKPFTDASIGNAVAVRAIHADLRAGLGEGAPKGAAPFSKQDRSNFLNAMEVALVGLKKAAGG
ncbi:MAG TPA: YaiI/YqxD family protein [Hyphomonas sp.]|nr:YaiI/YqxD family protein [Hyphomonas sp.]HRX75482.1 YaiI/YqxD family protein [Hyphomonas sp.]